MLPMLESCLALGTSNIYLSTLGALLRWSLMAPPAEERAGSMALVR